MIRLFHKNQSSPKFLLKELPFAQRTNGCPCTLQARESAQNKADALSKRAGIFAPWCQKVSIFAFDNIFLPLQIWAEKNNRSSVISVRLRVITYLPAVPLYSMAQGQEAMRQKIPTGIFWLFWISRRLKDLITIRFHIPSLREAFPLENYSLRCCIQRKNGAAIAIRCSAIMSIHKE